MLSVDARMRIFAIAAFAFVLTAVSLVEAAIPGQRHYALVIGHNQSDDTDLPPLRYADDDAIRYFEFFQLVADEAQILTTPDAETARLHPGFLAPEPTREALLDRLHSLRDAMAEDVARGIHPILTFVYSGHGSYDDDGSGFLYLADGVFTTRDLYSTVLGPNRDATVILIIDACNAALLVHSRGPRGSDRVASEPSLMRLENFPNVGVILSSSTVGEVHEWGRYLAGIFSHEVRSALLGPGDIDGNGRVTFAELATFVAAANDQVDNPTIRLNPYIRPPLNQPDFALVDLAATPFPVRLQVDTDEAHRGHLLDDQLVRYLDYHAEPGAPFEIGMVTNDQEWVLVAEGQEWVIPRGSRGLVRLSELTPEPLSQLAARGVTSGYFEKTLFKQPTGRVFAENFLGETYLPSLIVERPVLSPWYENSLGWGLVGSGVAAAAVGAGFTWMASEAHTDAMSATNHPDRIAANETLLEAQLTSAILYGVGAGALAGGMLTFLLDREVRVERYVPPISVDFSGQGIRLRGSFD
jgi:hypothetical protein